MPSTRWTPPTDRSDDPASLSPARGVMMISQINDQEAIYFDPHRCPDTHCITKNHPLCMFLLFFSFFFLVCDLLCLSEICVLDCCEGFGGEGGRGEGESVLT